MGFWSNLFGTSQPQTMMEKATPPKQEKKGFTNLSAYTKDYTVAAALASTYTGAIKTKKEFVEEFDKVRGFYLVEAMLTQFVEDALTPDVTSGEILEISSENEEINKELRELQRRIDFDQHIYDIALDFISYGEYTLRQVVKKGEGVLEIIDDVDQRTVVGFYRQGFPHKFLKQGPQGDIAVYDPVHFAHFVIGTNKIRVDLRKEFGKKAFNAGALPVGRRPVVGDDGVELGVQTEDIPNYARIGRPVLFGVLSKIKELQLLEQLVPAAKLAQITAGSLVGVNAPAGMDPKDGWDMAREYEGVLNSRIGLDTASGQLTVSDILAVAGRIKVLPIFGEKGTMDRLEVRDDASLDDLLSNIQDTRNTIMSTIGVPPELLFGGDVESKSELLKRYARYFKKLKAIQYAISKGVLQICLAHLVNRGYTDVSLRDINIRFRNELVNIDELDKQDFSSAIVGIVQDVNDMLLDMYDHDNEMIKASVNTVEHIRWNARMLSFISKDTSIIKIPDEKKAGEKEMELL